MKPKIKFRLQKLAVVVYFAIFLGNTAIAGSNQIGDSIYYKAVLRIVEEISTKYPQLINNDSIFFDMTKCETEELPTMWKNIRIVYINNNTLSLPIGRVPVIKMGALKLQSTMLRINYNFYIVAVLDDQSKTWLCCDGCGSGGFLTYGYDCKTERFIEEGFSFYNCF